MMSSTSGSGGIEREWLEKIVKTILDLIVLRLLKERPRWGYEINIAIKDKFNVYLSAGTLYPLLHALDNKGLVSGDWDSDKTRGRRIYKITRRGTKFLKMGEGMLDNAVKNLKDIS
jgi:PadR family transcriptional regulator PadR